MNDRATAILNLRNIPKETYRGAKVAAAQRGMTLREFVIQAIQKSIESGKEGAK